MIKESKNKKMSIAKNGFLNAIKTLCSIIFPIITIPYVSRVLGADNLGKYNFANSVVNYFVLIASLGISTYAVRECSKAKYDQNQLSKISSELFSINICTMLLSYIFFILLMLVYPKLNDYRLLIIILSSNILLQVLGVDWINIAMEDFRYITIRTIVFQLLSLVAMFSFVKSPGDYIVYAVITVLAGGGASFLNIFYVRRFCKIHFTFKINIRKHFKSIFLVFSLLVAQNILSNLDITMLGILKDDTTVGLYSMSVKMYVTIEKVISSVALVLLPQMSVLFQKEDYNSVNILLEKVWIFIYSATIPFAVGLICLSEEILGWICGNEFIQAAPSLSILALSMFINLLGGSFWGNIILLPSNKEGQFMVACMISAIFNAGLNFYFIPAWGMNGAAFTTTVSTLIIYIICKYRTDMRIKLHIQYKDILGPIIGGAVICFICLASKAFFASFFIRITFSVLLGVVMYFVVLFFFENELVRMIDDKFLKKFIKKREI